MFDERLHTNKDSSLSAELVRTLEKAGELGVGAEIKGIDFGKIMER